MPITNDPLEDERLRRLYDHYAAYQQHETCPAERPFGPCTQRCDQTAGHDGPHKAQCFTWHECTCPTYRFDDSGDIEALPQGTNPDCRHCHPEECI